MTQYNWRSFIHMELTSNSVAYLKGAGSKLGLGQKIRALFCGAGTLTAVKSLRLEMVLKVIGASISPRAEQVDVLLPVVCKNTEGVHTPGTE